MFFVCFFGCFSTCKTWFPFVSSLLAGFKNWSRTSLKITRHCLWSVLPPVTSWMPWPSMVWRLIFSINTLLFFMSSNTCNGKQGLHEGVKTLQEMPSVLLPLFRFLRDSNWVGHPQTKNSSFHCRIVWPHRMPTTSAPHNNTVKLWSHKSHNGLEISNFKKTTAISLVPLPGLWSQLPEWCHSRKSQDWGDWAP